MASRRKLLRLGVVGISTLSGLGALQVSGKEDPQKVALAVSSVESIADLVDIEPASAPLVAVRGYQASDDGGGGIFRWNPQGKEPADAGTIFRSNKSGSGRWQRVFQEPGRPEWFGAKGNGTSDDTLPLNAVLKVSMEIALMPGRIYLVQSVAVPANRVIRGNGATIRQMPLPKGSGLPILAILGPRVDCESVRFDGQRKLQPSDGFSDSFDTGSGKTGRAFRAAIRIDGALGEVGHHRFTDCRFEETYGACIAARRCSNLTVERCIASHCNFELLMTSSNVQTSAFWFVENHCEDLGTGDGRVQANACVISFASQVVAVSNTFERIERNAIKIEQTCSEILIANNRMKSNSVEGFAFVQIQSLANHHARSISIIGNTAVQVGAGIAFNSTHLEDVIVSRNVIESTISRNMGDGVQLGNGDIRNVTVASNTFRNILRSGIVVAQSSPGAQVSDVNIVDNEFHMEDSRDSLGAPIRVTLWGGNSTVDIERLTVVRNRLRGASFPDSSQFIELGRRSQGSTRILKSLFAFNSPEGVGTGTGLAPSSSQFLDAT
jgi:hypothetical protein